MAHPRDDLCPWIYFYRVQDWTCCHGTLNRYVKFWAAHAPGMPEKFSPPPRVSDPDMQQGTCVTHVPRCMLGSQMVSFEVGGGENVPAIPGSCTTRNFTYLVIGPWPPLESILYLELDILQDKGRDSFRLCNWPSIHSLVPWINHLPTSCVLDHLQKRQCVCYIFDKENGLCYFTFIVT